MRFAPRTSVLGLTRLVAAVAHAPTWTEPRRILKEAMDVIAEGRVRDRPPGGASSSCRSMPC